MKVFQLFKESDDRLETLIKLARKCKDINELARMMNSKLLMKLSFGFSTEDIITIPVKELKIKHKIDWNEAYPYNVNLDDLPPIDVSYKDGRFWVEDGHHRLKTAIKQKLPSIKCKIERIYDRFLFGFTDFDSLLRFVYEKSR